MNAHLTMTDGARAGARFPLDPGIVNRIGRGVECQVVLVDPLCSRIHAVVFANEDGWWVRDEQSRNGTFLDGQKIDEARLVEGASLRIGSTVFVFSEAAVRSSAAPLPQLTQTIILDTPIIHSLQGQIALPSLAASQPQDLVALCDLSVKLLACSDPDVVVRSALEMLLAASEASWAGFLWITDDGGLKPKLILPEAAGDDESQVSLSRTLTDAVCQKRRAVWVDSQMAAGGTESLSHFADAICVPLLHEQTLLGAVHLYSSRKRFRQNVFDLAVAAGGVLSAALARSRASAALLADHRRLLAQGAHFGELVGESPPMRELKSKIARVAKAQGCVLIRGQSGSGKELVAKALHQASPRADRPMLSVNCAAIPPHLMESALFGHKKGAFTGADEDRQGWFQQADSGTLFLDELGEMTLDGQAKLLRVLEGHPFLPVGGNKEVRVDVRVIAATNRDLAEFVREKKFREDLFYRLSVFELQIPPLRQRGNDIELLVDMFLDHFRRHHGRPELRLSPQARRRLLEYHWPGNVRQLRNVIDSAAVMADGDEIQPHELGLRDTGDDKDQFDSLRIDVWEQKLIREALRRADGNIPEAAKLLGLGRATLYRKIEEYRIER